MVEWVGVSWVSAHSIQAHFDQFSRLFGGGKVRKKLGGLWICIIWVLWKWRNSFLFEHKEWNFARIEEEIKCRFWSWNKVPLVGLFSVRFGPGIVFPGLDR